MKNVLYLNLRKKWFDMILSGEKTEEYREIKDYWMTRLIDSVQRLIKQEHFGDVPAKFIAFKEFDIIEFRNGYSKNAPRFQIECKGIEIGQTKYGWSDGWAGDVFVIKLGKIIGKQQPELHTFDEWMDITRKKTNES